MPKMKYMLKGYQILEKLYEGSQTVVYRGKRTDDQQSIIAKFIKNPYPTLLELAQFRHQYAILKRLDLPGVIKVYSLEQHQNRLALILEDHEGISLSEFISTQVTLNHVSTLTSNDQNLDQHLCDISIFFPVAIQLAKILDGLYYNNVIHKDIKPENILINPKTLEVKLIDFSIASCLTRENQTEQNPNLLQGTLAYISPEQTGRMNRGIDYRTDFYSLGITFYQLLTGRLPFESSTPLQLIHDHIAYIPTPPNQINLNLPLSLNQIILKLMAKMPEDRYQTAYGLKADLLHSQSLWAAGQNAISFNLGTQDISDQFLISEKLYGREQEIETLISAFDRVSKGRTEVLLVSGLSGMGKTTLIQEVHKPIARQGGYFICGKFNQLQNDKPLSGLVYAFRDLIQQLLTENNQNLELWKSKILKALGGNGQILIEVLPELELLIGKQPPVSELDSTAAQNQFNFLFQRFIRVFPDRTHPLVLFLDDLQWADFASLQLIQSIITQTINPYLLIIGSYRSEEVSSAHPLQLTIDAIRTAGIDLNVLPLTPFKFENLNHLISDTLNCLPADTELLAEFIHKKTEGNPFFSIQIFNGIYKEKLLIFDLKKRDWQWDLLRIQTFFQKSNVVEFVACQILKLSPSTQEILKFLSCKGESCSEYILSDLLEVPIDKLQSDLWEALQSGLIISNRSGYNLDDGILSNVESLASFPEDLLLKSSQLNKWKYSFIHDRIQQAAYSLLSENQQKKIHLKIGYYILNSISFLEKEERIFEIVNQLNFGIDLIKNNLERKKIAELNLVAGTKAKRITAYRDAAKYYINGIQLLDLNSWQTEYELSFGLYYGAAETSLQMGNFEQVWISVQEIERQAMPDLDRVKVCQIRLAAFTAQGEIVSAISAGLAALNILKLKLPESPQLQDFQSLFSETQAFLDDKAIEKLAALPFMSDPTQLVIMELIGQLLPVTYSYNPLLFSILILKLVDLSQKYGNSPISSWGYITFGIILWRSSCDLNIVYKFGKIGVNLGHKFGLKEHLVKVYFTFNYFIRFWKEHLRETLLPLRENYVLGLESGDLVQASFSLVEYIGHSILCGSSLILLEQEVEQYHDSFLKLNQEITLRIYEIYWQTILNLIDETQNPVLLNGKACDESLILLSIQKANNIQAIFLLYLYKSYLCYLFRQYSDFQHNIELAELYLDAVPCRIVVVIFHFYRLLGLFAAYPEKSLSEQNCLLEIAAQQTKQLEQWAESAPMNFSNKFYLVKAEWHRVLGEYTEAMSAYDQAIKLSQEYEYLNEEALAHELAGVFYLDWGKTTIAQIYLINAYYAYERWGAKAKLSDLEQRYPTLLNLFRKTESNLRITTLTTFSEEASLNSNTITLDWGSVMRASQALSQEIDLDRLLATIMQVVIENAGAEHGSLLLMEEEGLVLKAHCNLSECYTEKHRLNSGQIQWHENLPESILNYVERTQKALVLANAMTDTRFTVDPYIAVHKPLSILCMPIQSQGKLVGLLYLENNLTTDTFTTDRLEVLQLLTAQAAISLENAQLYASVEEKVKERTLELQIAKQDAERAKEESEKANLAKSEFLANMSHELRTPLNAVLGFSQLLHRDPFTSPEQRQKIGIINRSGEHLLTLINDVLTMSKIESGRTTLNENDFDLRVMLLFIHDMLLLKANSKNLKFEVECSPEVPQFIRTDEGKLRQVLVNLLGNAIKFTQQGWVKLGVSQISLCRDILSKGFPHQTVVSLHFEVKDTGAGIAPQELKDLFEAFVQTDAGRQSQEGTGLGLPISRTFIQLMGGEIKVNSTIGEGSCFSFNIDASLSEDVSATSNEFGNILRLAPGQLTYRILIVEDRWENQQVLIDLLDLVGFEVQVASNGKEAIAACQTYCPHLILMDLQMPAMDGYEALLMIQHQSAESHRPLPIMIAVTANTFEDTRAKALAIGFDDFVHKPFQVETLLETVAKHLGVLYFREGSSPATDMKVQNEIRDNLDALKSEDFQNLSSEWKNQVFLAASALDESRLLELIQDISEEHPKISSTFINFLKKFRFDQIVDLIEPNLGN